MKVQVFAGLTAALVLACIPLHAHAQGAAGGIGSAVAGAAEKTGRNAAGQALQNMGSSMMASPAATASPAMAGAPSMPVAPAAPSMPGVPPMPSAPSVPSMPVAPPAAGY